MSGFELLVALLVFVGSVVLVLAVLCRLTAMGFLDHEVERSEPTYAVWSWQLVALAALLMFGGLLVLATIP